MVFGLKFCFAFSSRLFTIKISATEYNIQLKWNRQKNLPDISLKGWYPFRQPVKFDLIFYYNVYIEVHNVVNKPHRRRTQKKNIKKEL